MEAPGAIRRLWAIERGKVRDHLLRLDAEDRLLRFGGHVSDERIEAYCGGLDWSRAAIVGYVVDGEVRGLGELKPMAAGWSGAAEAALSVERAHQNRGIGTELLRRLIVIARNRSIRTLHMLCLLENTKVLRIARRLGARLTVDRGGVEGRLALSWPDHLTLLLELLDDASTALAILRLPRRTSRARAHRRSGKGRTAVRYRRRSALRNGTSTAA